MRDVAAYARIKAPSVTSLVGHLLHLGLVKKCNEPSDKRVVRLFLTERGTRELKKYGTRCVRTMHAVFSKLPSGDIADLARILRRVGELHHE